MKTAKLIGMIHLPGINDEAWAEYLKTLKPVASKTNLTLCNRVK